MRLPNNSQGYSTLAKALQIISLVVGGALCLFWACKAFAHVDMIELPSFEKYKEDFQRELDRENEVEHDDEGNAIV